MKSHVIIYSRPGCHLCDEAKEEILAAGCSELFDLEEVNIDHDSTLLARYRYDIPVIMINGVEIARHRLTAGEFKGRLLDLGSQG